jgi:polysaccharide export outer membrane protein
MTVRENLLAVLAIAFSAALSACSGKDALPPGELTAEGERAPTYRIGAGDALEVTVWRNDRLSRAVSVRPDGRITLPLIKAVEAAGKTPTGLSEDLETKFSKYVENPLVSVRVTSFTGTFQQQVRVVGEAANPQAIPYRADMTLLDVMIAVGGLTEFAAGDRATLVRTARGDRQAYEVKLGSLLNEGEIQANRKVMPGDILIIPETVL